MSWLKELTGGGPAEPYKDTSTDKVRDPTDPDRLVSNKTANRPFLAYKEYRVQQEALHKAWLEKKKEHDEKVARGEKVGPLEPDPTAIEEVDITGFIKFIGVVLLIILLSGKFFTGSFVWGSESKWLRPNTYRWTNERLFSEEGLAQFKGQDGKPLYLAIDGDVYDVSSGHAYQPGGSYHHFAGIDAARAFGTGCFATHQTHDLRGLSEQELDGVAHWKKFYAEHKTYFKVGRVEHPPIDPSSPIPEHCDPKKAQAQKEAEAAKAKGGKPGKKKHDEL